MNKIEWSDELSVGVEQIDNQHKELIRIANALLHAASNEKGQLTINNVVRKLREYTVLHFNSEEALMKRINYDKYSEHAAEHEELKKSVKHFQRKIYEGEEISPKKLFMFMKVWLLKHILESDRKIVFFKKNNDTEKI